MLLMENIREHMLAQRMLQDQTFEFKLRGAEDFITALSLV